VFDLQHHAEWPHLNQIKDRFLQAGFKIYLVGGCVRDMLLSRKPKDFDFATDAKPEEMQKLFPKTNDIGAEFGTIQVVLDSKSYEITTFRKDLAYKDGRHPEGVEFSDEVEDAKRRDFTMNALFYNLETHQVIDHVNGLKDLNDKVIRFIGDAHDRIEEDKLRLLRALRFVSVLGFDLEPETAAAVKKYVSELKQVSRERIHEEITKLIAGDFFHRVIPDLRDTGMLSTLFDDSLDQTKLKDFLDLSRKDFTNLQVAFGLQNTLLFSILFFGLLLNTDNFDWRKWRWSRQLHMSVLLFRSLTKTLSRPIRKAELLQTLSSLEGNLLFVVRQHVKMDASNQKMAELHYQDKMPFEKPLPEPLLSGQDLMAFGVKPGREMGQQLQSLYEYQIENQITDRDILLKQLREK
jgi:tRNA nucleotidyltransferase/poly(A) polymerase